MIYVTSDWHLSHNRDFVYAARGFKCAEEMNEALFETYWRTITPEDTVYFLGDMIFGTEIEPLARRIASLPGRKLLAFGNHDSDKKIEIYKAANAFDDIQFGYRIKHNKSYLLLTHRPMLVDNFTHDVVFNIHGHTHSTSTAGELPNSFHAGVDAIGLAPISLECIVASLKAP